MHRPLWGAKQQSLTHLYLFYRPLWGVKQQSLTHSYLMYWPQWGVKQQSFTHLYLMYRPLWGAKQQSFTIFDVPDTIGWTTITQSFIHILYRPLWGAKQHSLTHGICCTGHCGELNNNHPNHSFILIVADTVACTSLFYQSLLSLV